MTCGEDGSKDWTSFIHLLIRSFSSSSKYRRWLAVKMAAKTEHHSFTHSFIHSFISSLRYRQWLAVKMEAKIGQLPPQKGQKWRRKPRLEIKRSDYVSVFVSFVRRPSVCLSLYLFYYKISRRDLKLGIFNLDDKITTTTTTATTTTTTTSGDEKLEIHAST